MKKLKFEMGNVVKIKEGDLFLGHIGTLINSKYEDNKNLYLVKLMNGQKMWLAEKALQKLNEVHREANLGEYIEITKEKVYPLYKQGDIFQVITKSIDSVGIFIDGAYCPVKVQEDEYVVLEDAPEENTELDNKIDDKELIISITDKNIIVSDEDDMTCITYKRNDKNTLLENISDALEKYKSNTNINIGDIVKVVHTDYIEPYDAYRLNDLAYMDKLSIVARYAYGYDPCNDVEELENLYRVLEKYDDDVFLIEEMVEDGLVLIVEKNGLEKVCGAEE